MKNLFLIRHAKSDWNDAKLDDFDRPLNKRGRKDAPFMAEQLSRRLNTHVLIISSPANRAFSTASEFAKALSINPENIIKEPKLYEASVEDIIEVIEELPEKAETVLLFGHNPGITWAVNNITGSRIDNVPTCGICEISVDTENWSEAKVKSKLLSFHFPKESVDR
ncbi:MAG: histidine phosphatase family protein [Bacteroidetes bacterium]|nr:histidine phosphatase family protein [Bacteroidota bacterium]MBU1720714.1 histidine phosphatase family protein [Bacteroidota bacterium]